MAEYFLDDKGNLTLISKKKKKKENTDSVFKAGAFSDGYDVGDGISTILGTIGDVGVNVLKGATSVVEGVTDLATYGIAGMSDLVGADDFANHLKKEAQKSYTDSIYDGMEGFVDQYSVLGDKADMVSQGLGQVGLMILTGGLGASAGLGTVGTTALTTGLTFASSTGSGMTEAYQSGATDEEAVLYGTIAGFSDSVTELLFGGLGKSVKAVGLSSGLASVDDMLAKKISSKFTNQIAKNITEFGVKASAEGLEEVLAGIGSAVGKKVSYMSEKELSDILADENLLEQFIVGSVTSGFAQSGLVPAMRNGSLIETTKQGRDFVTGYTQNEQKVIDAEVENRIAEAEANGKKLTNKEKNNIIDEVQKDLENGEISIDSIEKTLGGETYAQYQSILDKENEIKKKISETESNENLSDEQKQILKDAYNKEITELDTTSNKEQLKSQLSEEVQSMLVRQNGKNVTSDNYLIESYNEKARRGQQFEADLTQYDEKQRAVIQSAIDSGILNNTKKTHNFVDLVAKLSADKGVSFDFTDNQKLKESKFALEGKTVNGFVENGKITLNVNSSKALNTVVGHEITHILEGTNLYTELQNTIIEYAKSKGDYQSRFDTLTELYKDVKDADINSELTADLVGDYLFTDTDFINNLSVEQPNIFKKIYDEIKYMLKIATAGSKEARQLEEVKRKFEKAYQTSKTTDVKTDTETTGDTKYSLNTDSTSLDNEYMRAVEQGDTKSAQKFVDEVAKQSGYTIKAYHGTGYDFTVFDKAKQGSNYGDWGRLGKGFYFAPDEKTAKIWAEKSRGSQNKIMPVYLKSDKMLDAYEKLPADLVDTIPADWDSLTKRLAEKYSANYVEYMQEFGYDVQEILSSKGYDGLKADDTEYVVFEPEQIKSAEVVTYDDKGNVIPLSERFNEKKNDIRYSLSEDSEGRTLSENQIKYFKDSKVVDENGALKVMYHGTANDFTVFNPFLQGGKNGIAEGYGIYFADTPEVSDVYGGKLLKGYLKVTHPATSNEKTIKKNDLARLIKATAEAEAKKWVESGDYDNVNDAIRDTWVSNYVYTYDKPMDSSYREVADSILSMNDNDMDIVQEVMSGLAIRNYDQAYEFYDILKGTLGIDGFITEWQNNNISSGKAQIVVAFDSNQFKAFTNEKPTDNPDINLSLSNQNDDIAPPIGNYNVYGSDIQLEEIAPPISETEENIPIRELNQQNIPDEYAPLTEAEANERDLAQSDRINTLDESYMPDEEIQYYQNNKYVVPDVMEDRDIKSVGNRKVKAYMYENPEVKPYFQAEAQNMLYELKNSVKGERQFNSKLHYDTGGEKGWFGTTRETSDDIAYYLDNFNYTYADIEKGLNAIIKDEGAENNAISKRLEFAINDRLKDGYTDFMSGEHIPANQEYVDLLISKDIQSYSDDAYMKWLETLANEEAPPVAENTLADDIPIRNDIPNTTDTPISEGIQREFDTETGQIVDEKQAFDEKSETSRTTRKQLHARIVDNIKQTFAKAGLDFDKVLKNAKNKSTFASVDNTPQRFIEKSLGPEEGRILNDLTINKVAQNESAGVKWVNSFTDKKNGLLAQISKEYGIKPKSKESALAQMYGEGFYVNENDELVKYGDTELAKDVPDATMRENIKKLAKDERIRKIYDDTLSLINASRTRNAYPEIPRRNDYFLHFRAMEDTFSRLGLPFNPNDIRAKDLPTDINGMTADLKPGQPYFASAMQRKGNKTTYDLLGGLERYLNSAKNQIYHIDDIQTLRALRNYIADTYGQAKGLESLDDLTDAEAEERIKEVYSSHLSTFARFLNEEANVIAGKTALVDRGLEGIFGRRGITTVNEINQLVGRNMIGFNVSSALTGFVSSVQAFAKSNKADSIKAFAQTVSNRLNSIKGESDGFAEKNPLIIRRKGVEKLSRTPVEKVADVGYSLMSAVDNLSTEFIVRTKFNELTRNGMSEEQAHIEADKWASRILGDRTIGQQPLIFNSKTLGLFTKFQLEVRNQLDSQFYDTIQEAKVSNKEIENALTRNVKTASKITSTVVQLAVFQHLFGKAFESVAGYNPTFDIVEALMTMFGLDDEEESEDTPLDNLEQGFLELLGDLPYSSLLTDGGRIPITSAIPISQFITGEDEYGNEKSRWETVLETLPYLNPFGGSNQIKKTMTGLGMFDDDLPIAGSYTDSGNLRYPVEDTPLNRLQAGLFGQWANENARDYLDNERQPLKEKQIEEFKELDIPIRDYWKYREGLTEQKTIDEKFDYIAGLDLPVSKKNIMINNIVDREEAVDLEGYEDFSSYEEFDFATKYPEKYSISQAVGGYESFATYLSGLNDITADKDANGKTINGSRKKKVINYLNNLKTNYGTRLILYKMQYPSDNSVNRNIVRYLGELDIPYSEKVAILQTLGMTVDENGTVRWN